MAHYIIKFKRPSGVAKIEVEKIAPFQKLLLNESIKCIVKWYMSEQKAGLDNPEKSTNEWVEDLLNQARNQKPISEPTRVFERSVTFDRFIDFFQKFPQYKNSQIRYFFVKGWARELVLQAEEISQIDSKSNAVSELNSSFRPPEIKAHGDIDIYIIDHAFKEEANLVWRQYEVDYDTFGKTLADYLLREDSSEEQSTRDYFCKVKYQNREFVIPRPEVIFLDYASRRKDGTLHRPEFLKSLDEKYNLDINLIEKIRNFPGVKEKFDWLN